MLQSAVSAMTSRGNNKFIGFQLISIGTRPLFKIICHCSSANREEQRNPRNCHQMAIIRPGHVLGVVITTDEAPGEHADGRKFSHCLPTLSKVLDRMSIFAEFEGFDRIAIHAEWTL